MTKVRSFKYKASAKIFASGVRTHLKKSADVVQLKNKRWVVYVGKKL